MKNESTIGNDEKQLLAERDRLYLEAERQKAIDAELAVQRALLEDERVAGLERDIVRIDDELVATESAAHGITTEIAGCFHAIGKLAVQLVGAREKYTRLQIQAEEIERGLGKPLQRRGAGMARLDVDFVAAVDRASNGFALLWRGQLTRDLRSLLVGMGL